MTLRVMLLAAVASLIAAFLPAVSAAPGTPGTPAGGPRVSLTEVFAVTLPPRTVVGGAAVTDEAIAYTSCTEQGSGACTLVLRDLATRKRTVVWPGRPPRRHQPGQLALDEKWVAFELSTSADGEAPRTLWVFDRSTGRLRRIAVSRPGDEQYASTRPVDFALHGDRLAYALVEGGRRVLRVADLARGTERVVARQQRSDGFSLEYDGERIVTTVASDDPYRSDIVTYRNGVRRLLTHHGHALYPDLEGDTLLWSNRGRLVTAELPRSATRRDYGPAHFGTSLGSGFVLQIPPAPAIRTARRGDGITITSLGERRTTIPFEPRGDLFGIHVVGGQHIAYSTGSFKRSRLEVSRVDVAR